MPLLEMRGALDGFRMESIFPSSLHHHQQPIQYPINHHRFVSQGDLDKLRDGVVFLTVHDVGASFEVAWSNPFQ